jgi:Tol biopolymer transport system component
VREPVFSPDGKEIAFWAFADQMLKRLAVSGESPAVDIVAAETPTGIDWWSGGILYGQGRNGIYRVSPNGGEARQVARVAGNQSAHGPHVLPDGDHFLYTTATGTSRDRWDKAQIVVQSLNNPGEPRPLISGSDARYLPTGHLVYAVGGRLHAVRFDAGRLEVRGTSVPVEEGVSRAAGAFTGAANFSVADNGLLIYVPGPMSPAPAPMAISLIDLTAHDVNELNLPPEPYDSISMSPDETRIAFGNERDKEWTIYTYVISPTNQPQPLTSDGHNRYPAWTRDSKRLAFQSTRGKERDEAVWWQAADGSDEPTRLTTPEPGESHVPESWSKDGTLLYSVTKDGKVSLWTLPVRNGQPGKKEQFGQSTSTHPMSGQFSPDGTLIAYTLTERGTTTVCVERFPTSGRKCLPPRGGDSPKHPRWSPDSRKLFYDPRVGAFESVSVVRQPELDFGAPQPTNHPFRLSPPGERTPYDVSLRTGRILGLTTPGKKGYESQSVSNTIRVVVNWFEVLKTKLPQ